MHRHQVAFEPLPWGVYAIQHFPILHKFFSNISHQLRLYHTFSRLLSFPIKFVAPFSLGAVFDLKRPVSIISQAATISSKWFRTNSDIL
jgi:hypothetical protein